MNNGLWREFCEYKGRVLDVNVMRGAIKVEVLSK
jgi:hypothetical protein